MAELPRYRVSPFLMVRPVEMFTNAKIVDMLDRAEAIGFNLDAIPSPLEDLTLRELDWLTAETRGEN